MGSSDGVDFILSWLQEEFDTCSANAAQAAKDLHAMSKPLVAPTNPRAAELEAAFAAVSRLADRGSDASNAWQQVSASGGATVDTLQITDCPNIALRAHVSVRAPPAFVRQLLTDRSRVTAYDAMVTDIDLIEEIDTSDGKAAEVRYVRYAPIFPTSAREMVLLTGHKPLPVHPSSMQELARQGGEVGTETLGSGKGTLIASVSVEHPARTTPSAGAVRARLLAGGWTITPHGTCEACAGGRCSTRTCQCKCTCKRKRTAEHGWPEVWSSKALGQCCGCGVHGSSITLYAQVDPGGWIPVSLSNWAASELPMKVLLKVADICGGVTSLEGRAKTIS